MFLNVHALHTLPYSNVNRDDTNSPKTCSMGGVERIRVSSQSWKRVVRLKVEEALDAGTVRTRRMATEVREALVGRGWSDNDARRAGRAMMYAYGLEPDVEDDDTNVMLWVPLVAGDLADLAEKHRDVLATVPLPEPDSKGKIKAPAKKEIQGLLADLVTPVGEILGRRSPTIAMLGRMLADRPDHNIVGLADVMHAFTVHEAVPEFDYFTAVDDLADGPGVAHIGSASYSTGTFYRWTSVNITQLAKVLGRDAAFAAAREWARLFLITVPDGKQTGTGARTVADLAHVTLRDAPLNLAPAYDAPVVSDNGYLVPAANALGRYSASVTTYIDQPNLWDGYASTLEQNISGLGDRHPSLTAITDAAAAAMNELVTS